MCKNLKKFLHTSENLNTNDEFLYRNWIVFHLFFTNLNLSIRIHNQKIDYLTFKI